MEASIGGVEIVIWASMAEQILLIAKMILSTLMQIVVIWLLYIMGVEQGLMSM